MKEYFTLQFKMTNRKFKEFGVDPIFAYPILVFGFIGFSLFIFQRTEYAKYLYLLIAIMFVSKLSEIKRNEFLELCFGFKKSKIIRILENLIVVCPFIIFLIYKQHFYFSFALVILPALLALVDFKTTLNFVIPTPFYKKPFEFCVGFRNTFYLFIVAYCLTAISIFVDNLNLGIFALLLTFGVTLSYYTKPENEYFIWNFNHNPKNFLIEKIKIAMQFAFFLALPIFFFLSIFYYQDIDLIILFFLLGFAYLAFMILAKYSNYPDDLNINQGIFLMISILFPPLLMVLIPYLFNKSKKRLSDLLK